MIQRITRGFLIPLLTVSGEACEDRPGLCILVDLYCFCSQDLLRSFIVDFCCDVGTTKGGKCVKGSFEQKDDSRIESRIYVRTEISLFTFEVSRIKQSATHTVHENVGGSFLWDSTSNNHKPKHHLAPDTVNNNNQKEKLQHLSKDTNSKPTAP